jgi:putative N6-adenine-specific DNA methylase
MTQVDLYRYFISCPPGLEPVLAAECRRLSLVRVKTKPAAPTHDSTASGEETGGIEYEGPLEHIYKANLHLRTASRVSARLGEFYAAAFSELRKKASRLEWEKYLIAGQKVNIRAVCHKSKLYHSDGVVERVLGAINDHFSVLGKSFSELKSSPDGQLIQVRLVNDQCTISVDSSGELLHRRGYRLASAKAPLRENLAAAMLLSSGWEPAAPLIDPFCGSGTIPIEAALIARNVPPGLARQFQFLTWPKCEKPLWQSLLEDARKKITHQIPVIFGFDRDTGGIDMAITNAARAGQKDAVQFRCQAVSYLEPPDAPGWIVTNPPYGVRVSEDKDLRDLYARFGSILKSSFKGWQVSVLSSEERLLGSLGLGKADKVIQFANGGIPVKLARYSITN